MENLQHMLSIMDIATKVFGVRKTKAWELMSAPEAPKPIKLGTRTTRWLRDDVLEYARNLPRKRHGEPPELKEARGRVHKASQSGAETMSDFEVHPPGTAARLQAIDAGGCAPTVLVGTVVTAEPVSPNNDEVICPACCHQFRAIPVNVQADLARERDRVANALRLLDDYRERGGAFPTYAQLRQALEG